MPLFAEEAAAFCFHKGKKVHFFPDSQGEKILEPLHIAENENKIFRLRQLYSPKLAVFRRK